MKLTIPLRVSLILENKLVQLTQENHTLSKYKENCVQQRC